MKDIIRGMLAEQKAIAKRHGFKRKSDPSFLPVYLAGGIGDVIAGIDALEFLKERFEIVLFTPNPEVVRYFSDKTFSIVDKAISDEFTWHLIFDTVCKFKFLDGFHGFLLKSHEELYLRQQAMFEKNPYLHSLTEKHFHEYHLFADYGKEIGHTKRTLPLFSLGYDDIYLPYKIRPRAHSKALITIHDGFDNQHVNSVSGRATKTWKYSHWIKLVKMIKAQFPRFDIVQIGSQTSRPIDGVDQDLICKTSLAQAFEIISASSLHIDGDSGLAHAATRMQVPTIVMWGPTPSHFYGYSQNSNIQTDSCVPCYGAKINWNDKCPLKYPSPICMDSITPEMVMNEVVMKLRT